MVQVAGSYKLDINENFAEYLKALGLPEVTVDGKKYAFKSSSKINLSFTLGEEFDEPMPIGITLKSTAKLYGNLLTITSKAPDGRTGASTYEFTDKGYVVMSGLYRLHKRNIPNYEMNA